MTAPGPAGQLISIERQSLSMDDRVEERQGPLGKDPLSSRDWN